MGIEMEEERIREIVREELERRDENFRVDRELHYRHHEEISQIDKLQVSHLDQHKWLTWFIGLWNSAASKIGNYVLIVIIGAIAIILAWAAALRLKFGF